jgi:hypothetical protein
VESSYYPEEKAVDRIAPDITVGAVDHPLSAVWHGQLADSWCSFYEPGVYSRVRLEVLFGEFAKLVGYGPKAFQSD